MQKHLHIVSFDVPYPPDYGGVIDVFYKLKALHLAGFKLHLHCFQYGRAKAPELNDFCESVNYYPRNQKNWKALFSLQPFTVYTRQSKILEANLLQDNYPILFEVLHTCYLLNDERFKTRTIFFRHSNIEHHYYKHLALAEKNWIKKIYLHVEAIKLKRFEPVVANASAILAVNENDADYFQKKYPKVNTYFLPSFHEHDAVTIELKKHTTPYLLYHGNLSISENYQAVLWLVHQVFNRLPTIKIIIAGKNPPAFLLKILSNYSHITVLANPNSTEMETLIAQAKVHVLYTQQATGLKLKLLNVLFKGQFVISNSLMLNGTAFRHAKPSTGLIIATSPDDYIKHILNCFNNTFDETLIHERKQLMESSRASCITQTFVQVYATFQSSL